MRFLSAAIFAVLCVISLAIPCFAQQANKPPIISDPVYTHAARLVDIDHGRRLNLYCTGTGSPTVVFDSGLGDSTVAWALVQPKLSLETRTCSYDRAGLGFSDAAKRPSTVDNATDDLHALLKAAHIDPPYILVGHSSAGMDVRVFADHYAKEVIGLVIVDGSHEDQSTREWAIGKAGQKQQWDESLKDKTCLDAAKKGLVKNTPAYTKCVGDTEDPHFNKAINEAQNAYAASYNFQAAYLSEKQSVFYASADETRATRRDFGDMPIVVLTHAPLPKEKTWTQEVQDEHTLVWEAMHNEVAAMSTHGVNEIVPRSGHYIQYDRPEIVIDAINQVMAEAKAHGP